MHWWHKNKTCLFLWRECFSYMAFIDFSSKCDFIVTVQSLSRSHEFHELHSRLPCLSLSPRVCSNSCPSSQWCYPTVSSSVTHFCPQSFPASESSNELALHIRWPKYWSFTFSISPSSEYSGWISFGIYWFDLLAVQGTLKSFLQQHISKASVLWCSTFFMVQISHQHVTTRKNHSLDYTMIFFFDCSEFNISEINIYLIWFPESTKLNTVFPLSCPNYTSSPIA